MRINGEVVNQEDFWSQLEGFETVNLSVLRAGKEIELESPVFEL